ncbi:hypothetical protein EJ02DRAFT_459468 [Clathrospora elynae]|uniref:Ubiquitin 3 binding protein But2 C-terminal domain-containing protein n=1 Tax=Clathrospora elynae TaxID=706981 RepID=A0A6A5S9E5_9PLEO|nr:hypothetical protein EJ02DRAFT_459468 [Clathrospora elynae]
MKAFALLSAFLSSALAAPPTTSPKNHTPRTPSIPINPAKCPINTVQLYGNLPKGSISPSAIVPISSLNPNKAFFNTDWANVTPNDKCTIFNFELDSDATEGKICNVVFDFPDIMQAPGLFMVIGSGRFTFTKYDISAGAVPGWTTFANQPRPGPYPTSTPAILKPGNSYVVDEAPCGIEPGSGKVTVSGSLCSKDTTFWFKQSNMICPLGFYVVLTDHPIGDAVSQ